MSRIFASGKVPKVRRADHAGSWYSDNPQSLRAELQSYLDAAPDSFNDGADPTPVKHARVIIGPHAGYRYSGPTAGVAYKALALDTGTANVFVLGPSHHVYLETATVSDCDELETPLGNLIVNRDINTELQKTELFKTVSKSNEEAEHSMEMHFPFVKLLIDQTFAHLPADTHPKVVPIMIGNASASAERLIGDALAPYLKDRRNIFVVSSDFAHWGRRFSYTYYVPKHIAEVGGGWSLKTGSPADSDTQIHESIERVDDACMQAISTGNHESFLHVLSKTGNTVCGRHPVGVIMAAITTLKKQLEVHDDLSRFIFTDYQRSSLVENLNDSSVSYASAYAKVECMDVLSFVSDIEEAESDGNSNVSTLRNGQHMPQDSTLSPVGVATLGSETTSGHTGSIGRAVRPAFEGPKNCYPETYRARGRSRQPRGRTRGHVHVEPTDMHGFTYAHSRRGFRRTQRHMVVPESIANHYVNVQSTPIARIELESSSNLPKADRQQNPDDFTSGGLVDSDHVSELSKQQLRQYLAQDEELQLKRLKSDDSLRAHGG